MKNFILCFCISFYCVGTLSAQSDSLIIVLEKTLQAQIDTLGEEHLDVAMYCDSLGVMYAKAGRYMQADSLFSKALDIKAKKLEENHPDIAESYHNLGNIYWYKGNYTKADTLLTKALNMRLEVLDKKHPDLATSYNSLGIVCRHIGDYEKAISFYNKALNIRLEVFGENHFSIAQIYNNLGNLYSTKGDHEKAISFHDKALNIRLEVYGQKHSKTAQSYHNLGVEYNHIGDYEKAISFYNKALNIALEIFGEKHSYIAMIYNSLGSVYLNTGDYEKAISFRNKALNIGLEVFGEKHSYIAMFCNNLGNVYLNTGNYEKAISFHNKALNIGLEVFGEKHSYIAMFYNSLGDVYLNTSDYEKAISFYNKALNIELKVFDEKHPDITDSYNDLAIAYERIGDYQTVDSLWRIVINQNIKRLNDTYLFLPDDQRLEYTKTFKERHDNFLSFTTKHGNANIKKLAAYLLLNTKSLALDYSLSVRELISNIGNEELSDLHNKANKLNENISQAELMTAEERKEKNWNLTAMRDQQENLSRQLLKDETLRERLYKTPVAWEDAQSKLKSNEAILDFARFYEESDSTWMYYAMLTRKNMSAPEFIRVTDEEAITALLQADNQVGQPNYIQIDGGLKTLYQKIWQPLTSHLKGIKTVHMSPAGLLHHVDFGVLQDENEKYLAEHFELHYYTAMRDFTGKKRTNFLSNLFKKNQYKNAVLLGDIAYDLSPEKDIEDTINIALRDGVDPLPATGEEINEINEIVENNGGSSIRIRGNNATENALHNHTGDNSSHIFHFATHGKYLSSLDDLGKQAALQHRLSASGNPLQRSMLMLSGANDTWTSKEYISSADKDGILTAYEVTHLDLSNTKLVVLSACNTGLGDIHDTEGVIGLQSAFKLAGVEHVVVSLWKVNDVATKELMVEFYKNLLNPRIKNKTRQLLYVTQKPKCVGMVRNQIIGQGSY